VLNQYSPEHLAYIQRIKRRQHIMRATQILLLVGLFALWEVAARLGWINAFIFSHPSKIWNAALRLASQGELWKHLGWTVGETAIGFTAGTFLGIVIAILLWWSDFFSRVLDPYIVVLESIPKVALGPIFVVWLGTTVTAVIAMAIAVSVIVTIMMMHTGFKEVDPNKDQTGPYLWRHQVPDPHQSDYSRERSHHDRGTKGKRRPFLSGNHCGRVLGIQGWIRVSHYLRRPGVQHVPGHGQHSAFGRGVNYSLFSRGKT
jgi:hypothetical protein